MATVSFVSDLAYLIGLIRRSAEACAQAAQPCVIVLTHVGEVSSFHPFCPHATHPMNGLLIILVSHPIEFPMTCMHPFLMVILQNCLNIPPFNLALATEIIYLT